VRDQDVIATFWARPVDEVVQALGASRDGLSSAEAARRLREVGANELQRQRGRTWPHVLWRQVRSPLVLLLAFAAVASLVTGQVADAVIVLAILLAGVGTAYRREFRAETAIAALLERIAVCANVKRDGEWVSVPLREVVPGDLVRLSAGSIVPADAVLLDATALHVNEAALTGESYPASKRCGPVAPAAPLRDRLGCVHFGTNVRSGTAEAIVVATGSATSFGAIAGTLATHAPEMEFERGLRRFGALLLVSMLVIVMIVFAVNVMLGRAPIETLLFSVALAVGLEPEMLPAIVGVNLAHAAQQLADAGVLCRRLDAIENLGSMDVLCTDKTGTLTEGVARVDAAYDPYGAPSEQVMELAAVNAALQSGLANPIDAALIQARPIARADIEKLAEVPYDFMRKRLSVVVRQGGVVRMITKGAFDHVIEVCARLADGTPLDREALQARYDAWSSEGIRVIAVAAKRVDGEGHDWGDEEYDLELEGFVTFVDRPKPDVAEVLADLDRAGVRVVMMTGDSRLVARHVARAVGLDDTHMLTGSELDELTDIALVRAAKDTSLFVELDPNQKERILRALRKGGAVVGFFGDGVNDTPAMHAADVSISVEGAVDIAKATADLVLTAKRLDVIRRGIAAGRTTFANTTKYILTTTSANLGNMISMAVASLVLPFLPLTAGQILLNNFLSDVPAIGLASDRVDPELVAKPRRWNIRFIGRFMLEFGPLSSVFDALTFAVLLGYFASSTTMFRTAWFVESLFTELAIALVVRTRRRSWRSAPGRLLLWGTIAVAVLALAIPYLPFVGRIGFVPIPASLVFAIIGIAAAYVLSAEALKAWFYRR
jgi:Mg2+-importing ATPase